MRKGPAGWLNLMLKSVIFEHDWSTFRKKWTAKTEDLLYKKLPLVVIILSFYHLQFSIPVIGSGSKQSHYRRAPFCVSVSLLSVKTSTGPSTKTAGQTDIDHPPIIYPRPYLHGYIHATMNVFSTWIDAFYNLFFINLQAYVETSTYYLIFLNSFKRPTCKFRK